MIDLRYHIASLVAVFLALGIGILIGTTLLGNDTLVEYQKQVTSRLESQLEELRQKNESIQATAHNLEMDLNMQKEFNQKVLPVLVKNRLENINLAVVETSGYYFSESLMNTLELAGADVTSVTSFLTFSESAVGSELSRKINWNREQDGDFTPYIARKTVQSIINGNVNFVNPLSQSDILQVTGSYGAPLDGVILVGGSQGEKNARYEKLDKYIIEVFQNRQVPVYGVEETAAGYSYIDYYQKQGLTATVDNVDTVPGQLALVLSIDGQPGHYGVKSTARRLMPEIKTSGVEQNE